MVEFTEPECAHWNFQLCNHWMENLANCMTGQGYVDKENVNVEPDGTIRIVVSHTDPGAANWIDPEEHSHGVMGLRLVRPVEIPDISCRVVPVAELA